MSGTPSEAEVQAQLVAVVDILETQRAHIDGTMAANAGPLDVLLQAIEGTYTPDLVPLAQSYRATLSSLIDSSTARGMLDPVLFEYGRIITDFGGAYTTADELSVALYDWFVTNGTTIQSRAITYDTSATAGGSNVGGGGGSEMSRLTVDAQGYNIEACHVEKKIWKCVQDQNSGVSEHAEVWECQGAAPPPDAILRGSFGSGLPAGNQIRSHHTGSGTGGSLLSNSSFSQYGASDTPKFTRWTETAGGANIAQDTTNYYRSYPGSTTNASLRINGGGGQTLIKQPLSDMRVSSLDPNVPYFCRLMWNRQIGSGSGGTLTLRMGNRSASVTPSAQTGWQELLIAPGTASWFENFNEDPFDIEIEWDGTGTSGYLLIDDVIFAPWDQVDGTYWFLRLNHTTATPWLRDDTLTFTDTGGAAGTGKIQWWFWTAGLGYLPSSGTPSLADPS